MMRRRRTVVAELAVRSDLGDRQVRVRWRVRCEVHRRVLVSGWPGVDGRVTGGTQRTPARSGGLGVGDVHDCNVTSRCTRHGHAMRRASCNKRAAARVEQSARRHRVHVRCRDHRGKVKSNVVIGEGTVVALGSRIASPARPTHRRTRGSGWVACLLQSSPTSTGSSRASCTPGTPNLVAARPTLGSQPECSLCSPPLHHHGPSRVRRSGTDLPRRTDPSQHPSAPAGQCPQRELQTLPYRSSQESRKRPSGRTRQRIVGGEAVSHSCLLIWYRSTSRTVPGETRQGSRPARPRIPTATSRRAAIDDALRPHVSGWCRWSGM